MQQSMFVYTLENLFWNALYDAMETPNGPERQRWGTWSSPGPALQVLDMVLCDRVGNLSQETHYLFTVSDLITTKFYWGRHFPWPIYERIDRMNFLAQACKLILTPTKFFALLIFFFFCQTSSSQSEAK